MGSTYRACTHFVRLVATVSLLVTFILIVLVSILIVFILIVIVQLGYHRVEEKPVCIEFRLSAPICLLEGSFDCGVKVSEECNVGHFSYIGSGTGSFRWGSNEIFIEL
jgi:hypothetical protein